MPANDTLITKAEILQRFDTVLKPFIENITDSPSDNITLNGFSFPASTATGEAARSDTLPSSASLATNISDVVSNSTVSTTGIARNLVNLMRTYALSYRVRFTNSQTSVTNKGITTDVYSLRFDTAPPIPNTNPVQYTNLLDTVESDVLAALANRGISTKDALIDASNFENFITDCRNIWSNRCNNTFLREFVYTFCHTNHVNHVNHGSRGRR